MTDVRGAAASITPPARPLWVACHGTEWSWERSAGRGGVDAWTVTDRSLHPAFTGVRYAQVVVETDEGPRVLSSAFDVPPEELELGMRVSVAFLAVEGTDVPGPRARDG